MVLPALSGRSAIWMAAATAAPDEMPTRSPLSEARRFFAAMASSEVMGTISSTTERSKVSGTKPAPIPWILWLPEGLPASTCDSAGSTAMPSTEGFCSFRYLAEPEMVPPVPTPATSTSTVPSVSRQISGPVVS